MPGGRAMQALPVTLLLLLLLALACTPSNARVQPLQQLRRQRPGTADRPPIASPQGWGGSIGDSNAITFQLVTFGPADSSCTGSPTGGIAFQGGACTPTPSSLSSTFHSMRIKDVAAPAAPGGNYSLLLYFESTQCDDFVGLWLGGILGDNKRACFDAAYQTELGRNFFYQVRVADWPAEAQMEQQEGERRSWQRGDGRATNPQLPGRMGSGDGVTASPLAPTSASAPAGSSSSGEARVSDDSDPRGSPSDTLALAR